jgi:hypothetical protein
MNKNNPVEKITFKTTWISGNLADGTTNISSISKINIPI